MSACEVLIMVAVLSVVLVWVLKELTGTSLQSAKFVSARMLVGVSQKAS